MSNTKSCQIQFRVSEEELNQIRINAGAQPISAYLRSLAIAGPHPLVLEICTDDLDELGYIMADKLGRFETYIQILRKEEIMPEGKAERMETLLTEIRDEYRKTVAAVLRTRVSVKKAALREIRRQWDMAAGES